MRSWLYVGALAAVWVLLWGSASPANVLSGLAVGWLIVLAVPGIRPGRTPIVLRPVAIARLAGYVAATIVSSNVTLVREVLAPSDRLRTAVIGVTLPDCSDELLTLVSNLVAVAPGTMPLEVTRDPTVLWVHVLHLRDLDTMRRDLARLTDLTVRAFGTPETVAALDLEASR